MTKIKHLFMISVLLMLGSGPAFADNHQAGGSQSGDSMTNPDMPRVRLVTNLGDIVIELNREKAPRTVENFLAYVNDSFYSGTIFHRVIDGFMIQGGGFTKEFQKKQTKAPVENEANNGLKNERGTVAMARTGQPHSATAQFFINVVNNDFLNHRSTTPRGWGYAVFGKVVEGMEVVDAIRRTPTGSGGPFRTDVPKTPVIIESASLDSGTVTPPNTPAAPGLNVQ